MTKCSFSDRIGECPLSSSGPISRDCVLVPVMKGPVRSGLEIGLYSMLRSLFRIQCVKSCERAYYIVECIVEHSSGRKCEGLRNNTVPKQLRLLRKSKRIQKKHVYIIVFISSNN